MPSVNRAVEVKLPEAEVLADLYGIVFDLEVAAHLCAKAIELGQARQHDYIVVEGLVTAAVVRYGRCFSKGVRFWLCREDITEIGNDDLSTHGYFKDLRDKFVAHSVNRFEETYVTATASELDGKKNPIQSVGPGQHRVVLSPITAKALAQLVSRVNAVVKKRVAIEEQRLLDVIQALPLDAIHSGDLHTPRRLKDSDVSKDRKQKSRSNKALKGTARKRGAL